VFNATFNNILVISSLGRSHKTVLTIQVFLYIPLSSGSILHGFAQKYENLYSENILG